jgi:hypothetical protein
MKQVRILGMEINWMLGWANPPRIHVWVDEIPGGLIMTPHRSSSKNVLWYGEKKGIVRFFSDTTLENSLESKQEDGFAGRHFTIKTPNGEHILKGPWSSRASVMNAHHPTAIENPCTEIALTDKESVFEKGFTYFGSNITIDLLTPALVSFFDLTLYQEKKHGEMVFTLNKDDCGLSKKEMKAQTSSHKPYKWKEKI